MTRTSVKLAKGECSWTRDICKLQLTLPKETFEVLKLSALTNNRSLAMEARTLVQAALRESSNRVSINAAQGSAE